MLFYPTVVVFFLFVCWLNRSNTFQERVSKILSISGEDMEEIREVTVGNIGAAVGLKETRTGDTLISQDKKLPPIQLTGMCLCFIELRGC